MAQYLIFVVKDANGLSVVRTVAGFVVPMSECVSYSPITEDDMFNMTYDQGQYMMKRLGRTVYVKNGTKSDTSDLIVASWPRTIERAHEMNEILEWPSMGKCKMVIFRNNNGFCPMQVHSGDVFMLADLENLQPSPMTSEMATLLTKEELLLCLVEQGQSIDSIKSMNKPRIVQKYLEGVNAMVANIQDTNNNDNAPADATDAVKPQADETSDTDDAATPAVEALDESEAPADVKPVKIDILNAQKVGYERFVFIDLESKVIHRFKYFYCQTSTWNDVLTALEIAGVQTENFRLMFYDSEVAGYESIVSLPMPSSGLLLLKLVPKNSGGGKVLKHTVKMAKPKKTSAEDKVCFEESFKTCCEIATASDFDIKKGFANMSLESLDELRKYLGTSSHATNKVKMDQIHTYFAEYRKMQEAMENIVSAMSEFQRLTKEGLEKNFGNEDGKIDTLMLRDSISAEIGAKSSQSQDAMRM